MWLPSKKGACSSLSSATGWKRHIHPRRATIMDAVCVSAEGRQKALPGRGFSTYKVLPHSWGGCPLANFHGPLSRHRADGENLNVRIETWARAKGQGGV